MDTLEFFTYAACLKPVQLKSPPPHLHPPSRTLHLLASESLIADQLITDRPQTGINFCSSTCHFPCFATLVHTCSPLVDARPTTSQTRPLIGLPLINSTQHTTKSPDDCAMAQQFPLLFRAAVPTPSISPLWWPWRWRQRSS